MLTVVLVYGWIGLVVAAAFLLPWNGSPPAEERRSGPPAPTTRPSTPPPGPREPFSFRLSKLAAVPVDGTSGLQAAREAGRAVQAALSVLYDRAYADPAAWDGELPAEVWTAFAPSIRARARTDASSLTARAVPGPLAGLVPTGSALDLRVLVGPSGRAEAALAAVLFNARGRLASGEEVELVNRASLVLRPVAGAWRVVAYPAAASEVRPPAAPRPVGQVRSL